MKNRSHSKGTHEMNRSKMCLFCQKKPTTAFPISGVILNTIQNKFAEFDSTDIRLPNVICNSCRQKILYSFNKTSASAITLPDYSSYPQVIGGNEDCDCSLCNKIRSRHGDINLMKRQKKSAENSRNQGQKLCQKCLNKIGRGIRHKCGVKNLIENLEKFSENERWTRKNKEHVAAKFVKIVAPSDLKGAKYFEVSQVNCKPLKVALKPRKEKTPAKAIMTVKVLRQMQLGLNLSQRKTRTTTKIFTESAGKKGVEKNIVKKMSEFSHIVDKFLESRTFQFTHELNDKITQFKQKAVVCKDLKGFINFVINHRKLTDYHLKFGLDGGGKFLKFCLSIQSTKIGDVLENVAKKTRSVFKDSSVKKLFVIAIAESVQENYDNIKILWDALKLNEFFTYIMDGTITIDLKVANVLVGLMNHAASFPCTWCRAPRSNLKNAGELRSLEQCKENYENFLKTNDKKKAKLFENCVRAPIIESDKESLLEIIPPPELHLFVGGFSHVFESMEAKYPVIAQEWMSQCHVYKVDIYRGKQGFQGNQCKKLLDNIRKLKKLCNKYDKTCHVYVDVFEKFQKVVNSCFKSVLEPNFESCILDFQESFLSLKITVTSKIHAIFHHVKDFCESRGIGLGFFSEQAFESVHHDYQETWVNFKCKPENPHYGEKLLRSVCVYNANHL